MAKRASSGPKPKAHEGHVPVEERTGDVVPDVRVSTREHPSGRHVRLCLRRGGTPVALTPDEAEAVASELMDAAKNSR